MPCIKTKDGFVCEYKTVEHGGFLIEFPPIGCPVPLNKKTLCPKKPTREFWDALESFRMKGQNEE